MRIALFGGTFDPPHRGHIAVARAAADAFQLDQVLFAPTGRQPLKLGTEVTPFAVRMELVSVACQSDARFIVSDIDAPRLDDKPNYTVETLAELRRRHPADTIFNIVGADSFLNLRHWKDPESLLALAEWIVATRPGYALDDQAVLSNLQLSAEEQKHVHMLAGVYKDISGTQLRQRLGLGKRCSEWIDDRTAAFIRSNNLYV